MKKSLLSIYFLVLAALICEILYQILFSSISLTWWFFFAASILISASAIIIRLKIIDPQKFSSIMLENNIQTPNKSPEKQSSSPIRFLNVMPIAMLTCSLADGLLLVSFIIGMLTFLISQILYITAYSGIVSLKPKNLFMGTKKLFNIGSIIFWILIPTIIYILFIYSPTEIMTIMVIPYVVVLTLMTLITFFNLIYKNRPFKFRISLCGGGISFFISDSLLAFNEFKTPIPVASLLISATYLLAVFLLQFAVIFLDSAIRK